MKPIYPILFILLILLIPWTHAQQHPDMFEYRDVDQPPQAVNYDIIRKRITYPKAAQKAHLTGDVFVRFLVDETGKCIQYQITRGAHPILNQMVVDQLPYLRFDPARHNGKAVAHWVNLPVKFRISYTAAEIHTPTVLCDCKQASREVHKIPKKQRAAHFYLRALEAYRDGAYATAWCMNNVAISASKKQAQKNNRISANLQMYHLAGLLGISQKQWQNAREALSKAIMLIQERPDMLEENLKAQLYIQRGFCSLMLGQAEAIGDFQTAVRLAPDFQGAVLPNALELLPGELHYVKGQVQGYGSLTSNNSVFTYLAELW
ncbi:MAG: energy transducer TonB [Bacteroidota bacterium]